VLANGPDQDAVRPYPGLTLGAHLNILRGAPLSPPREVASLVGENGLFLGSFPQLALRALRGQLQLEQVRLEWSRQVAFLGERGVLQRADSRNLRWVGRDGRERVRLESFATLPSLAQLSPDAKTFFFLDEYGQASFHDAGTGRRRCAFTVPELGSVARFTPDSGRLVLGGFLSAVLGGGWAPTWNLGIFDATFDEELQAGIKLPFIYERGRHPATGAPVVRIRKIKKSELHPKKRTTKSAQDTSYLKDALEEVGLSMEDLSFSELLHTTKDLGVSLGVKVLKTLVGRKR
jgi:hypothetical protein